MANGNEISQEILEQAQTEVREAMKQKRLSQPIRAILRSQDLFLTYLITDHKNVGEMYPFYQAQKQALDNKNDDQKFYRRTMIATVITSAGSTILWLAHVLGSVFSTIRIP